MSDFPHLPLWKKLEGVHKPQKFKFDKQIDPITSFNLAHREEHGSQLKEQVSTLNKRWIEGIELRNTNGLPSIPDLDVVPVFLKIDEKDYNIESLQALGIEIISEEADGFIIGAASDNFKSLSEKIALFVSDEKNKKYKDHAARLWQIDTGISWKVDKILSSDLIEKWDKIKDTDPFILDISIACHSRLPERPKRKKNTTDAKYNETIAKWKKRYEKRIEEIESKASDRQEKFDKLIATYGGQRLTAFIDTQDSFGCRVSINGAGLKDITLNYQYVFEIEEYDPFQYLPENSESLEEISLEIIPPDPSSPRICIIDSGIQESHKLLDAAILKANSYSFIKSDASTADVLGISGGHGTRVAGCALYPREIPKKGEIKLPFFIENARVLINFHGEAILPSELYPPELMQEIVKQFPDTKIFNLSINSHRPFRLSHMSHWAATIDATMLEHDVLFIVAAGNVKRTSTVSNNPGIQEHLFSGRQYPAYLLEDACRLGNPGQSSFALTVGSVCLNQFDDGVRSSFGIRDSVSSFSRSGLGIWNMIKPDIVEYGGDYTYNKDGSPGITTTDFIVPETVRSTSGGSTAVGRDLVGTSFAAPKVAHLVAALAKQFPNESVNFYRALVVHGARLPNELFHNPSLSDFRMYGYGIPSLDRSTGNSPRRITFYDNNVVKPKEAVTYSIKIPDVVRRPGDSFDILIEVSLSYMAKPRRTRRSTKSYLSQWLSWDSSKLNERFDVFSSRVLKDIESDSEGSNDENVIKWVIRERSSWSVPGVLKRQDNTLQKSWAIIKSYALGESISFAVIGHKGWENDIMQQVGYTFVVSFEILDAEIDIYNAIRVENQVDLAIEQRIEV